MKDPHDIRKAAIEDEIIARSEEASSKLSCFKCGDGSTPLYCLNCANGELRAVIEQCEKALEAWLDFNQMSIPNNADEQEAQGEQFTTVWFDTKDALAAIKKVKEGK